MSCSPWPGLSLNRWETDIHGKWNHSSHPSCGPLASPPCPWAVCGMQGCGIRLTSFPPPSASWHLGRTGGSSETAGTPCWPLMAIAFQAAFLHSGESYPTSPSGCSSLLAPVLALLDLYCAPGVLQVVPQVTQAEQWCPSCFQCPILQSPLQCLHVGPGKFWGGSRWFCFFKNLVLNYF